MPYWPMCARGSTKPTVASGPPPPLLLLLLGLLLGLAWGWGLLGWGLLGLGLQGRVAM